MICPACKADSLRPGKILCFHCWNLLTKALQAKVWKAWREFRGGGGAGARDTYHVIRKRAIDAATAARAAAKAPAR